MTGNSEKANGTTGTEVLVSQFDGEQFQGRLHTILDFRSLLHKHFVAELHNRLHGTKFDDEALISVLADLQSDSFLTLSKVGLAASLSEVLKAKMLFAELPMQRLRAASELDHVSLGPNLIGRGWHSPEPEPLGEFRRWSGPGMLSTIFVHVLDVGRYLVSGRVRFLVSGPEAEFKAKLGREFMAVDLVENGDGTYDFSFTDAVEEPARSNFQVIEFFNNSIARPVDVEAGNGDTRRLGFCLYSLSLKKI